VAGPSTGNPVHLQATQHHPEVTSAIILYHCPSYQHHRITKVNVFPSAAVGLSSAGQKAR